MYKLLINRRQAPEASTSSSVAPHKSILLLTGALLAFGIFVAPVFLSNGELLAAGQAPICGKPTFNAGSERGTFLWKDCGGNGELHIRVTGGGLNVGTIYKAGIQSEGGFPLLEGVSFESSDELNTTTKSASYALTVWNLGYDGIDFLVSGNACFTPIAPSNIPVYLGAGRTLATSTDVDLNTGLACEDANDTDGDGLSDETEANLGTDPLLPDTDGGGVNDGVEVNSGNDPLDPNDDSLIICGKPDMNAAVDRATFLWRDCGSSGELHLRVMEGGANIGTVFRGEINSAGNFIDVDGFSIETNDELDISDQLVTYALTVWNRGVDGIDFNLAGAACFTPQSPAGLPVYLGAGRTLATGPEVDLATGQACQPFIDSDGDGLSDDEETELGTNPMLADTDGGGAEDGDEVAAGKDPLEPADDSSLNELAFRFQDVSVAAGLGGFRLESWGAAWADLNKDNYPDLFMSDHRVPGRYYQNNGNGTFSNTSGYVDISNAFHNTNRDSHAATWSDFDNDGDPDLGIAVGSIGALGSLLVNTGGRLKEQRNATGLNVGVGGEQRMPIFFDYNNDGLLDVKTINFNESGSKNTLFRQNPNHTFSQVSNSAGLRCNNSDWAQLMDVNGSGQLEILCGDRNGIFPVAAYDYSSGWGVKLNLAQTSLVTDAVAADFNGDLRPDLLQIRGTIRPDQIIKSGNSSAEIHSLINYSGTRTFKIKTYGALNFALNSGGTKNWILVSKDGNGVLDDVYIGASGYHPGSTNISLNPWNQANHGLQNPGSKDGLFAGLDPATGEWTLIFNSTAQYSYAYLAIESSSPITSVSGSGYKTGNGLMLPKYLRNTGGNFVDATSGSGFDAVQCVSGVAGDFDNDMDQDVFLACRNGAKNLPNIFYENLGTGIFRRVTAATGAEGNTGAALGAGAGNSESVVTVDYDIDGFLDLLVTNGLNMTPKGVGGDEQLFRNLGNSNNWLELDLVGTQSNRDGIGAKILVTAGGVKQYREQNGGYHRWAQNHQRIHVGLGGNSAAAEIKITWPSGQIDRFTNIDANELYKVTEGVGIEATGIISGN